MTGSAEIHPSGGCANYDVFRPVVGSRPRDAAAEHTAQVAGYPAAADVLDCSWVEHFGRLAGGDYVFRAASFLR